ncbi:hypothetical protein [Prevotella sp. 10(H)]|uniref:hypothetical protein n=1 Tax=Prevotella sp. 10(H) TaxID=1158294 RepID=UPI0004A713EB|nr:hypothetical protein [Prevotella sp. 10(H)]
MKKHYLLIIAGLLSLTAMNSFAQKKTTGTTKKAAPATMTKATAGKIIEMTNGVVDIYNEQLGEIKDVADCLERFENTINSVAQNPNTTAYGAACNNIRPLRADLVDKMKAKATLAPSFPEKAAILEGIDNINKEFETAKERCHTVQEYFKTKQYKEDDETYSKYTALFDEFLASYENINSLFNNTMDLASAAGDRAEVVILKTHPLATVVVPMKTNLIAVSQLMSKCRQEEPDAEAVKADIAAIRAACEKDKVITPAIKTALSKGQNAEDRFQRFYEYMAEAMNNADNFLEYLDPNKEITDVDTIMKETVKTARQRHLKKHYTKVQDYYRYMVDAYNGL